MLVCVCVFNHLSVSKIIQKSYEQILMKYSRGVVGGNRNNPLLVATRTDLIHSDSLINLVETDVNHSLK